MSNNNGEIARYNVFFTSDLHIRHKNILRHSKGRIIGMNLKDENDILGHDEYIINMWKEMTKRGDHIYVLGDFIMSSQYESLYILNQLKLNGCKIHLIVGNHDKSTRNMTNMFESIDLIKQVKFKKKNFPFIEEDEFNCILCHYPMTSWQDKPRGSLQCYGHVHFNSPFLDDEPDLRFNVGLDNPKSNYRLFSLEQIYGYYKEKLNCLTPAQYIEKVSKENKYFVR